MICAAKLGILLSVLSLGFNTLDTNQTNRPFWTTKPPTAGMVYYCRRRAPFGCNTTPTVASSVPTTTLSPSPDSPPHLHSLSFYLPLLPHLCALTNCPGDIRLNNHCCGKLPAGAQTHLTMLEKHFFSPMVSLFISHSLSSPLPPSIKSSSFTKTPSVFFFFCTVCNPEKPQFRTQLIFGLIGP